MESFLKVSGIPFYLRHKSTDTCYHILAKLKSWNKKDQNLLSALCKVISTKSKSKKRGRKFPDSYFAEISSEICKISKNQCSNFSKIDCLTYSRNVWSLIGNLKFLNLLVMVKKWVKPKIINYRFSRTYAICFVIDIL